MSRTAFIAATVVLAAALVVVAAAFAVARAACAALWVAFTAAWVALWAVLTVCCAVFAVRWVVLTVCREKCSAVLMVCLAVRFAVLVPERAVLTMFCPPSRTDREVEPFGCVGPRTAWAVAYLGLPTAGEGGAVSPLLLICTLRLWPVGCAAARFTAVFRRRSWINFRWPWLNAWAGCSESIAACLWIQVFLVLTDSRSCGVFLLGEDAAAL